MPLKIDFLHNNAQKMLGPRNQSRIAGFSALDQVNEKVTPARLPKVYATGYLPPADSLLADADFRNI